MIRINLLPHREEKRKARRQQFYVLSVLVLILASLLVLLGYTLIEAQISEQETRNKRLEKYIAELDKDLVEIKRLKETTEALLARKRIIESLQGDRAESVHLLNEMVSRTPEGIYLRSIKQKGNTVTLEGITQSNARVSELMRNFEASQWLEKPQLVEIKSTEVDKRRLGLFKMTVMTTREKEEAKTESTSGRKAS